MKKEIRNILRKNVVKEREEKEPPLGGIPKKAVELMIEKGKLQRYHPKKLLGQKGKTKIDALNP
ncbi:MAG: hypothetical protein OD814_001344, partial [Candidatus Alkanophagales archaeon MCA70_species_1]|nr:hypothetical protein [Candidatus Alkanophaga volatiphilum]